MSDYQDRIDSAIDELRQWAKDNPGEDPSYGGTLQELADGCVPVYTGDILQAAMDNYWLAVTEPDIECGTASEMICANIYEDAYEKLSEAWSEIEQEIEDEEFYDEFEADPDKLYNVDVWVTIHKIFGVQWWCNSDCEPINDLYAASSFTDLLENIFEEANDCGVRKLEITWRIAQIDVELMAERRFDQMIAKQATRSTKVVKDE